MEKTQKFNSSILKVEEDYSNSQFSKATIRIMYEGHNRNGSYMVGDVINTAAEKSLAGVPIIGYYSEELEDFTDHATEIEYNREKGELEYKSFTVPYGFIPSEAKTYWEEVMEYDGTINNYLVVDGAILWTGRYPEVDVLTRESRNHSMEINIENGREAIIDGKATFEVTEFEFTGLCILANSTEPCFESSKISAFALKEAKFAKEFKTMIFELESELKKTEGGTDVSEKITNEAVETELEKAVESTEEANVETEFEQSTEQVEEPAVDEFAKDDKEDEDEDKSDDSDDDSEAGESDDEDEKKKKYEAEGSDEGEETPDLAELLYKLQKDNEGLKEEFIKFKSEFEKLEAENAELKTYKRKRESEDLRGKFGNQVTEEEFESALELDEDLTIVEEKLYALIGKKTYALDSNVTKANKQKIVAPHSEDDKSNPFGSFFN